ncbi:hypothetical protein [Endozoicomonas sp. 4G]|uniref:hypothetical protein n=1 Tax=Endozoicomonas sp. 4G TaxID=2872754 RepID=UPI00207885FE|nr:hypothetical protein [Endozoicomonas sp. 4G]
MIRLPILTLVIAFSVHCSNGYAQENRLPLRFALAVGRVLIDAPKSFTEVLSIKRVYVTGVETVLLPPFPVWDGLLNEQESEAIEWWELKVHSRAASDHGSDSEGSNTSDGSSDNRSNEDEANTESDVQYETTTVNLFRISNETSQYCTALELKNIKQEPDSDSEIATNGTSDKSIDNRSNEDESDPRYVTTTLNPFRVSNEISQYGATLELKKIKEEPVSDSEILADSEVDVTKVDTAKHQCDHEGCDYRAEWPECLKRHKQTHLPADQRLKRLKIHQCDHEDCNYSTDQAGNLNRHKQTHLPADQRPKRHQCDRQGCNYSTDYSSDLKRHKQKHLSADQRPKRPKLHQCDHEDCNYSTDQAGNLNRHKQIHLPADQRPKRHQCDRQGCNYSTDYASDLKRHKQKHLSADQRLKRPKLHQCDHEGCNYSSNRVSNLNTHKRTHLPADQRLKRKAYDQPPSNAKRKKGDKE